MVDRGAMLPNEWRATLNMAPIPGGDEPIRRLDTQVVNLVKEALGKMDSKNYMVTAEIITRLLDSAEGGDKKNEIQD